MRTVGTPQSGAVFSDDGKYRYRLWRAWSPELPRALFILLNPSTADDIHNDPTVERQQRRVFLWSGPDSRLFDNYPRRIKFGSIEVVNACAYRSTDPMALFRVDDPVGDENGEHIHIATQETILGGGIIVCGWGAHAAELSLGRYTVHSILLESLESAQYPLSALALNNDGTPQHPLYLSYGVRPRRWAQGVLHEEVV